MHQLVHENVREEGLECDQRLVVCGQHALGNRYQHVVEFRLLKILEHSRASSALSATTRSSFGRLYAAVCTPWLPSPEQNTTSATRIGEKPPSFRITEFRLDGQVIFQFLQFAAEARQQSRCLGIGNQDERLEGRFEVEPLIFTRPRTDRSSARSMHRGSIQAMSLW